MSLLIIELLTRFVLKMKPSAHIFGGLFKSRAAMSTLIRNHMAYVMHQERIINYYVPIMTQKTKRCVSRTDTSCQRRL
jgi:hypothetical protein